MKTVRNKTGLLIDPYFSASKIAWILDHVRGARARAEQGKLAFGTVDSWLIWNLTSGKTPHHGYGPTLHEPCFTTSPKTSGTRICCKLLQIPESMLPEVVWSSGRIGQVTTTLGLGEMDIAGIAGDQQSALFGQLCIKPGDAKNTYGTGCFLLQNIGDKFRCPRSGSLRRSSAASNRRPEYAFEGSIFIGGAVVQWLRDKMKFFRACSGS